MAYRRRWARRRPKNYSQRVEVAKDASEKYVKEEFFKLSPNELIHFGRLYRREHGTNAHDYFRDTYSKWQEGKVWLSGQTMQRLLQCVPPILAPEKQFYLLSIEVQRELEKVISKSAPKKLEIEKLNTTYEQILSNVQQWDYTLLRWFVKGPFDESTLNILAQSIITAATTRIIDSYENAILDIRMMVLWSMPIRGIQKKVTYTLELLKTEIEVKDQIPLKKQFSLPSIDTIPQKYQIAVQKFVLDRLLIRRSENLHAAGDRSISAIDLNSITENLFQTKNRVTIRNQARGAAGVFDIRLDYEPLSFVLLKFLAILIGIVSLFGLSFFMIKWLIGTKVLLIAGVCIYGIFLIGSGVVKLIKQLSISLKQLSSFNVR